MIIYSTLLRFQDNTDNLRFNTYADAVATARVFALTSPDPASTMPPPPAKVSTLKPYPKKLSRQLNLTLFPLDITTPHLLRKSTFDSVLAPLVAQGSPLAEWTTAFVHKTYEKMDSLKGSTPDPGYVPLSSLIVNLQSYKETKKQY